MEPLLIVDSHQDIAYNMLTFDRDYLRPVAETRDLERGTVAQQKNGDTTVSWQEYQRGGIALVFATLFGAPIRRQEGGWDTQVYADVNQANRLYRRQLELYLRLVDDHPDHFRLVRSQADLQAVLEPWRSGPLAERLLALESPRPEHSAAEEREQQQEANEARRQASAAPEVQSDKTPSAPVGLVILMEGAEGVRAPGELDEWWELGVRLIGPAWAGTRFCGGTREPGPLTSEGYELLEGMAGLGFSLDLSHMDEIAALQALDFYAGPIVATHANAASLLKGADTNRHLSDQVIAGLLERDAIIGLVPANAFLKAGWKRPDRRELVSLQDYVAQIDYICQMAGDARHAAIGSDYNGGFGWQSVPAEVDTIADLRKIIPLLYEKGYTREDVAAILGGNWIRHLQETLPESE